ncbi:MAG: hypothetical protein QXF20_00360 [Candidatus Hadarchaeales archaeon]
MKQARILALGSIGITALAVFLFTFFPSSPEIAFIFAVGVAFVILLLVALPLLGRGEESPFPEEERKEIASKLKEALEEEKETKPQEAVEEKPQPNLLSCLREISLEGWKMVSEGGVKEETLLGTPGKGEGFFRIWEGEKGRRLALYTLLFPSPEEAKNCLQEILARLGDWLYESYPGRGHFYLERESMDGAVWKKEEVLVLLLLGEAKRGEASAFLTLLPEALKPL